MSDTLIVNARLVNEGREFDADLRISRLVLPITDPVGGQGGPVLDKWH